jgi:hypothetical protein
MGCVYHETRLHIYHFLSLVNWRGRGVCCWIGVGLWDVGFKVVGFGVIHSFTNFFIFRSGMGFSGVKIFSFFPFPCYYFWEWPGWGLLLFNAFF